MKKGLFIVIEGIDGSGKGTQARLLHGWLKERKYDVLFTSEPTDSMVGSVIRKNLRGGGLDATTEALLFAADREIHNSEIRSGIEDGKIVLSDRYVYSSLAYQGARGLNEDWIKNINRSTIVPDLLIILDISPEIAIKRVNNRKRREEYFENVEFLKRVREIYLKQEGVIIDASKSIEEVHREIKKVTSRFLRVVQPERE